MSTDDVDTTAAFVNDNGTQENTQWRAWMSM